MMQWCIDMNLEPILAVWGGLYLDGEVIAQKDLQPYIDDVLNELEFLLVSTLDFPAEYAIRFFNTYKTLS